MASTYSFKTTKTHIQEFTKRFPFSLTESQDKAIRAILDDFSGAHAMSRLLEGDVGSGKTVVLVDMIVRLYDGVFDKTCVFSSSTNLNSSWNPVKLNVQKMLGTGSQKEKCFFDE